MGVPVPVGLDRCALPPSVALASCGSIVLPGDSSCLQISLGGANFGFGGLFFAALRWRVGFERTEEIRRDNGDFVDGSQERGFVCLRRFVKPANFSDELE
jgi:hypothetical protein